MAGNRYKRMPRFNSPVKNVPTELRTYLDQLSAEIEKGFLEVDRVVGEDDSVSVTDQVAWFMNTE